MIPRISFPQNIKTPDYIIDGARFDLKTPEGNSKNTIYGMVKSKKKQANNYVICADKTPLDIKEIDRQIQGLYCSQHTRFVDTVVLIKDYKIIKAYKK